MQQQKASTMEKFRKVENESRRFNHHPTNQLFPSGEKAEPMEGQIKTTVEEYF